VSASWKIRRPTVSNPNLNRYGRPTLAVQDPGVTLPLGADANIADGVGASDGVGAATATGSATAAASGSSVAQATSAAAGSSTAASTAASSAAGAIAGTGTAVVSTGYNIPYTVTSLKNIQFTLGTGVIAAVTIPGDTITLYQQTNAVLTPKGPRTFTFPFPSDEIETINTGYISLANTFLDPALVREQLEWASEQYAAGKIEGVLWWMGTDLNFDRNWGWVGELSRWSHLNGYMQRPESACFVHTALEFG